MKKTLLFVLLLFDAVLVFGQSISRTMLLLPDTGQTTSYTTTFGEDHDYAINTPSYTDNGDGTITDNITGLMWQKIDGGSMNYASAITYCDNLTLANYTDWRLPIPMEAFSIMILQNGNPAINTLFFSSSSALVAEYWWTNTTQFGDNSKVWCTNAGGGIGNKPKSEAIGEVGGTFRYNVRAVRNISTPATITNHFTDNLDGTITDNLTQLIWQKVPNASALNWEQALTYAEGLSLGNASDWRLPNIKELQSLNNESAVNPSVFSPYFQNLGVKNYWSSTTLKPNPQNPNSAWYLGTQYGITTYDVKTNTNYVICVKGNPTLSVKQEKIDSLIQVFPNPFKSTINLKSYSGNENYELYSSLGKLMYNGPIIEKQDFSALANGVYFLRIKDKAMSTIKLIKE